MAFLRYRASLAARLALLPPSLLILCSLASPPPARIAPGTLPADKPVGTLELVASFEGSMPTGVTVAPNDSVRR